MELLVILLVAGAAAMAGLVFVIKLVVGLVILPFKILGLAIKAVGSLFGLAVGLVGGLLGLLVGLIGVVVALVALPLIPLLVLGGIVWLVVRAVRPRPIPAEVRVIRA